MSHIWSDTFGVQDTALKTPVITDAFLNTYIAGTEHNQNSGVDILLRKLDEHGDLIWQTAYTNSGAYRDQATDIALDDSGNVYLCGASYVSGNHYDFLVLKFDSAGTLLWDYNLNGSASQGDGASAIFIDSGSVFVTGPMTNIGSYVDYRTIRLSAAGVLQWQSTYNFVNLADVPFDITVSDGNVFVTGGSQNNISDWDYASIQLLSHNGLPVDTSRTGGTGVGFDHAAEAIADDLGHYYITGTFQNNGNKDFRTVKFDANLDVLWAESFDFDGENDEAFSLTVDPFGNVYVAGTSRDSANAQFTIVKYDSTGTLLWVNRSGGLHYDKAARIACDDHGNVYATGERGNGFNADFYTLALDATGHLLWYKLFNGASNGDDKANMISVKEDFIVVSGTSFIHGQNQYISIAYGTFNIEIPPDTGTTVSSGQNWFYPQSGQILNDTSGTADIQYYTLHHSPALFLKDETLSFVWAKTDTSSLDTLQRIDQVIVDASATRLYEYSESDSYLNYYLPQCPSGITNVHGYKYLSIPEVYRDVNLYYTSNRAGLKQLFMSKPGTKPTIELQYNGADTILIDTAVGSMEIIGQIGSFKFAAPYAYEVDTQGNIIPGTMFYPVYQQTAPGLILIDNISYNVGNALVVVMERYQAFYPLDTPVDNLNWSTFFGTTTGFEMIEATCVTDNDDFCVLGNSDELFYPTLLGTTINPPSNALLQNGFLFRLDENKEPQNFVFFGGSLNEYTEDISAGSNNQCILTFFTSSADIVDFSSSGMNYTTGPPSQATYGYIIVFNQDGSIAMDSYIPAGGGTLYSRTVAYDPITEKTCIVGEVNSSSGFPIKPLTGAYNQGNGAQYNGFIMELDDSFQPIWSTIFGGDGRESISGVEYMDGNIIIMGRTSSQDLSTDNVNNTPCAPTSDGSFPNCVLNTTGTYNQNTIKGSFDNFFAVFNSNRELVWCTPFGGDGGEAYILGAPDNYDRLEANSNNFYFLGVTDDESGLPLTTNSNYFQSFTANNINCTNFVGKFIINENSGIELKWCTFIEGMDIADIYCDNDRFGMIGTNYANSLEINNCSDTQQPDTYTICNDNGQAYIQTGNSVKRTCIKFFSNSEEPIWSTLYGNNITNQGATITCSSNEILIGGYLPSATSPWTLADPPGNLDYFQPTNLGGSREMALASFKKTSIVNQQNSAESSHQVSFIYPNPVENYLIINGIPDISKVELRNVTGQSLLDYNNLGNNRLLSFPDVAAGIYLIVIRTKDGHSYPFKVIKN